MDFTNIATHVTKILIPYIVGRSTGEFAKKVGNSAYAALSKLANHVVQHLKARDEDDQVVIKNFEKDPDTYEKPFAKILSDELMNNEEFASTTISLVKDYNKEINNSGNVDQFKIEVSGDFDSVGSAFGGSSVEAKGDIVGRDKKTKE